MNLFYFYIKFHKYLQLSSGLFKRLPTLLYAFVRFFLCFLAFLDKKLFFFFSYCYYIHTSLSVCIVKLSHRLIVCSAFKFSKILSCSAFAYTYCSVPCNLSVIHQFLVCFHMFFTSSILFCLIWFICVSNRTGRWSLKSSH